MDIESFRESLKRIALAAPVLNERAAAMNAAVREVEAYLERCGAGFSCREEVFGSHETRMAVLFCRVGQKYRIAVQENEGAAKPWLDCDRRLKLLTFSTIPMLIGTIAFRIEQILDDNRAATAGAAGMIEAIKSAVPARGPRDVTTGRKRPG